MSGGGIKIDSLYWDVYADTRRFVNGIGGAELYLSRFARAITTTTGLLVTLGVVSAIAGGKALAMAATLDKEMRSVSTVVQDTASRFAELKNEIIELSKSVPDTPPLLTRALYDIVQAGILNASDAMLVLRASVKLAGAGMTDTASTADALTGVLNAYRLEASEATHVSDIMFETIRLGKVHPDDLARALGNVTTTSALAKLSLEEMGSAIATLTLFNLSAEESTLALNRLLLSIIHPSRAAAVEAKKLGIEWNANGLAAKGFSALMQEVNEKTGGNIVVLQKLMPNIRAARAGFILTSQGASEYRRILDDMSHSSGAADRAFEKMRGSAQAQYQIFKNNLNVALYDLGNKILPTVIRLLETVNRLMGSKEDALIDNLRRLGVQSEALTQIMTKQTIMKLQTDLGNLHGQLRDQLHGGTGVGTVTDAMRHGDVSELATLTEVANRNLQQQLNIRDKLIAVKAGELHLSGAEVSALERQLRLLESAASTTDRRRAFLQNIADLMSSINEKQQLIDDLRAGRPSTPRFPPGGSTLVPDDDTPVDNSRRDARRTALMMRLEAELARITTTTADNLSAVIDKLAADFDREFGHSIPESIQHSIDTLRVFASQTGDLDSYAAGLEQVRNALAEMDNTTDKSAGVGFRAQADALGELRTSLTQYITGLTAGTTEYTRAQTLLRGINDEMRKLNQAELKSLKAGLDRNRALRLEQRDMTAAVRDMEEIARSALQVANAMGLIGDEATRGLSAIVQIAANVKLLSEAKVDSIGDLFSANNKAATLGAIGGVAAALSVLPGIMKSLFGESPEEKARREELEKNTAAIDLLRQQIGEWGVKISGGSFASARTALAGVMPHPGGMITDPRGFSYPSTIPGSTAGLAEALARAGLSMHDLAKMAEELHISFSETNPTLEQLQALLKAINATELTQFAETATGQLELLRHEFEVFDITDPIEQLKKLNALLSGKYGSSAIAGALAHDLTTSEGRHAAELELEALFRRLQSGGFAGHEGELGGLTPEQFLQAIEDALRLIRSANGEAGTTQDATRQIQITEVQASRLLAYQSTQTYLQGLMESHLAKLAGVEPGGGISVSPPTLTGPGAGVSAGIVITEMNINVSGASTPAQGEAVGQAAADGFIQAINRKQGLQVVVRKRAIGDVRL